MPAHRALTSVVAEWLPHLGAPADLVPAIAQQVSDQLEALPDPLRLAVSVLDRSMSLLPRGTAPHLAGLPGTGEYVRLVRSLTTVVYFAQQERTT